MRSSHVHWQSLNSSSPGVSPIFGWVVDLYANKNLLSLVCAVPFDPSYFFIRPLKMWTDLNTWSLEGGYPGAVFMHKIPFLIIKVPNSSLVNPVPLSETTISGNPWVAKTHQSNSIVAIALILDVGYTFIHLLHALISIRNKCPINGLAWFICKWDQGLERPFPGMKRSSSWCCPMKPTNFTPLDLSFNFVI